VRGTRRRRTSRWNLISEIDAAIAADDAVEDELQA
jgi:hypothetical protein